MPVAVKSGHCHRAGGAGQASAHSASLLCTQESAKSCAARPPEMPTSTRPAATKAEPRHEQARCVSNTRPACTSLFHSRQARFGTRVRVRRAPEERSSKHQVGNWGRSKATCNRKQQSLVMRNRLHRPPCLRIHYKGVTPAVRGEGSYTTGSPSLCFRGIMGMGRQCSAESAYRRGGSRAFAPNRAKFRANAHTNVLYYK